jgi:hypothetical protein
MKQKRFGKHVTMFLTGELRKIERRYGLKPCDPNVYWTSDAEHRKTCNACLAVDIAFKTMDAEILAQKAAELRKNHRNQCGCEVCGVVEDWEGKLPTPQETVWF